MPDKKFEKAKKQTIKRWEDALDERLFNKFIYWRDCGFCHEYKLIEGGFLHIASCIEACRKCPIFKIEGTKCTNRKTTLGQIVQNLIPRRIPEVLAILCYLHSLKDPEAHDD